jgi:hypothetical protein
MTNHVKDVPAYMQKHLRLEVLNYRGSELLVYMKEGKTIMIIESITQDKTHLD